MQWLNNLCSNCSFNSAQNILNVFPVFAGFLSLRNILLFSKADLRCVYTLRFVGPISYLGACYIRTKVTKCIREHMTMYFRGLTIKSHSSGYEIGPTNHSV